MNYFTIIIFLLLCSCTFFSFNNSVNKKSSHQKKTPATISIKKKTKASAQPDLYVLKQMFLSAKATFRSGKFKEAANTIEDLLYKQEFLPKEMLINLYQLKLDILLKSKEVDESKLLEIYCNILQQIKQKKSIYRKKAFNIVINMKEKELNKVQDTRYITPIKDLVFYQLGKILFYKEKFDDSHSFFKKFLSYSIDGNLEEKALKYLKAIKSRKIINKKHIGAILPLSGSSAKIGKRSLKGLQMGLGFYTNKKSPFQLIVLDSQGQADKARKAVEKLVTQHHVIAIVGGILSRTATAIAEEAQNFGIPVILTAQKSQLTKIGQYIFQNSLTSSLITNQLSQFLTTQFKIKTFAILYPNDSYGVEYANAFWKTTKQYGGIITGVQIYKPGETDFNGPIKRLIGTYYQKDRLVEYKEKLKEWYLKKSQLPKKREASKKNILKPIVDFEALFIPDSLKTLDSIASHLLYNDVKNIYLVGPSLWNQPYNIKKSSRYLKQAFFADTELSTKKFQKTDFYAQFLQTFDQKPGLFELLAYEAALILRQTIISGAKNRSELKKDLQKTIKFYGPLGELSINKNREFIRPLQIFKIENYKIHPVKQDF